MNDTLGPEIQRIVEEVQEEKAKGGPRKRFYMITEAMQDFYASSSLSAQM